MEEYRKLRSGWVALRRALGDADNLKMKGGVTASGVRLSIFPGGRLGGCGWFRGLVVLDVGGFCCLFFF